MHFIVIPDKHMQFFCLIFLKDVEKWVQKIKTIKKKKIWELYRNKGIECNAFNNKYRSNCNGEEEASWKENISNPLKKKRKVQYWPVAEEKFKRETRYKICCLVFFIVMVNNHFIFLRMLGGLDDC